MIIQGTKVSFEEMQVDDKEGSFSCCELWWVWLYLASLAFFLFLSVTQGDKPAFSLQHRQVLNNPIIQSGSYWIQKDMWIWYLQREWYFLGELLFSLYVFFLGISGYQRLCVSPLFCFIASLLLCFSAFSCFSASTLFCSFPCLFASLAFPCFLS